MKDLLTQDTLFALIRVSIKTLKTRNTGTFICHLDAFFLCLRRE